MRGPGPLFQEEPLGSQPSDHGWNRKISRQFDLRTRWQSVIRPAARGQEAREIPSGVLSPPDGRCAAPSARRVGRPALGEPERLGAPVLAAPRQFGLVRLFPGRASSEHFSQTGAETPYELSFQRRGRDPGVGCRAAAGFEPGRFSRSSVRFPGASLDSKGRRGGRCAGAIRLARCGQSHETDPLTAISRKFLESASVGPSGADADGARRLAGEGRRTSVRSQGQSARSIPMARRVIRARFLPKLAAVLVAQGRRALLTSDVHVLSADNLGESS